MCDNTSTGRVFFVGAGPGSGDLITVRGAKRIAEADVVVWPSATVATEVVREHARPDAELVDSSRLGDDQLVRLYRQAAAQRSTLVRLVPGDAAVWTGLQPHLDLCRRLGLGTEIVPGVSPLAAAVAATGRELADPAVLLTQFDPTRPWTPPHPVGRPATATSEGVVAVSTSAARTEALVARLRAAGHAERTPVTVVARTGRPDEVLFSTTLGELDEAVKRHRLWVPALFLVGRAPSPSDGSIQYSSPRSAVAGAPSAGSSSGPSARWAVSAGGTSAVGASAGRASGAGVSVGEASAAGGSGYPGGPGAGGPGGGPSVLDGTPGGPGVTAGMQGAASTLHRPYRRRRRPNQGGSA